MFGIAGQALVIASSTFCQCFGQDVGLWPTDFPGHTPDLWLTGDHFVGKMSAVVAE